MLKSVCIFLLLSVIHSGACEEEDYHPHPPPHPPRPPHHHHHYHHHPHHDDLSDPRCDCQIPTSPNDYNTPLFKMIQIKPHLAFEMQFAYPHVDGPVNSTFPSSRVQLLCANNGTIAINSQPLPIVSTAVVKCVRLDNDVCTHRLYTPWNTYLMDFKSFSDISCTVNQVSEAHSAVVISDQFGVCKRANNTCTTCVTIGFPVTQIPGPRFFMPAINFIAVDGSKLQPLVAQGHLPSSLHGHGHKADSNQELRKGPIFRGTTLNLKEVFQRDYQRKRFLEIFGNQKLVDVYIPETGNFHLTAAQLIAEQDLFYKVQKPTALFYENTVPIWRDVATGNWKLASEFLSKLAAEKHQGFAYYSGVIDILELADQQGNGKRIFLAHGQDGEPLIPVPKLLYKYIVAKKPGEPHKHHALVLITVNDPRLRLADIKEVKRGYIIPNCNPKPICQQMQPEFADPSRGYTYCCSAEEFSSFAEQFGLPHAHNSEMIL
ncbi:uncharacterized protein LOC107982018 isoform X1 [Nasonia vitripennis]|uniref:Uncharacterized protein n=1 Tax=Nasonia vitripennis TaxID=7425 RepID=A0A7M7J3W1_NASVI|nr:uncharacterized protein LOC107982018 isoform X1 [Nasonia vitripennis]